MAEYNHLNSLLNDKNMNTQSKHITQISVYPYNNNNNNNTGVEDWKPGCRQFSFLMKKKCAHQSHSAENCFSNQTQKVVIEVKNFVHI